MKIQSFYGDYAIIQCGTHFEVIGEAEANSLITGTISNNEKNIIVKVSSDNLGNFKLKFPPVCGGDEEYTLTVFSSEDKLVFKHILFGYLFLAAGQSNMEYQLEYIDNSEREQSLSGNSLIRFMNVENVSINARDGSFYGDTKESAYFKKDFLWQTTENYEVAKACSGFAFLFAAKLFKKVKLPIGIINISVGGSQIENWLPLNEISSNKSLSFYRKKVGSKEDTSNIGSIYNEKIIPLLSAKFQGVLWYLGESSAWFQDEAIAYKHALKFLITFYRKIFNSQLNFLVMQIGIEVYADYGANLVNKSISCVANELDDVVECPIYDLPQNWFKKDGKMLYHSIHITSKKPSAVRAADLFLNNFVYKNGKKCPTFDYSLRKDNDLLVYFKYCGKGLFASDKRDLFGFCIANENRIFLPAKAEIIGKNCVKLSNSFIKEPIYSSYAFFLYNNFCNLKSDLPVIPYLDIKDDISLYQLAEPSPAMSCVYPKQFETTFATTHGGSAFINTWSKGELFANKNVKCRVSKTCVEIIYGKTDVNYYYFGATCHYDVAYTHNIFNNMTVMEIELESSNDIEFVGFHTRLTTGEQFYFCGFEGENLSQAIKVKSGAKSKIKIDLTKCFNFADGMMPSGEILKNVAKSQFTFRDLHSNCGRVKVFNITLH